ncbi:hypothetical protein DFH06DRAFT_1150598 [Mycena polygramma]|nr:hypothetical protein DFH06DRAFT_1150598 [Mycena polygramma]
MCLHVGLHSITQATYVVDSPGMTPIPGVVGYLDPVGNNPETVHGSIALRPVAVINGVRGWMAGFGKSKVLEPPLDSRQGFLAEYYPQVGGIGLYRMSTTSRLLRRKQGETRWLPPSRRPLAFRRPETVGNFNA